jgi:hypothetical protein
LHIDTLYVDKFLKSEALGLPDNDTGKKGKSSVMPKKIFIPKSQLKLNTTADRLYYQNGSVDQLQLEIVYGEDVIDIKQLDFFFADGHISTKGKVFNSDEHAYQAFINSTYYLLMNSTRPYLILIIHVANYRGILNCSLPSIILFSQSPGIICGNLRLVYTRENLKKLNQ